MGQRFTITDLHEIATGLTVAQHPAAHRALRKAAQLGALGPGERIDAKGTQAFAAEGALRACLIVALAAAEIHGEDAARALETADAAGRMWRGRLDLAGAIAAARRGEPVEFRRVIPGRGLPGEPAGHRGTPWWGTMFIGADEPLPALAASALVVNLNRVWAPAFVAIDQEFRP